MESDSPTRPEHGEVSFSFFLRRPSCQCLQYNNGGSRDDPRRSGAGFHQAANIPESVEVIIVGDRCDDNTDVVVAGFCDRRFQFFNLDTRGPYPRPGRNRWMVTGIKHSQLCALTCEQQMNETHLDEDDTYEQDRIETLVRELQRNRNRYWAFTRSIFFSTITLRRFFRKWCS